MADKTKLELTWIGKEERPRLEPRILLEDPELSHVAKHRVSDGDLFDNMLIHGDNLLALKALEQEYSGQVKCVYIDPPFNTGQAFEHYDDGIEHSLWLSLMRHRVEALWGLLRSDGSLWVHCDDSEQAYLKVLLDEVCGRSSFVATVVWQARYSRSNDAGLSSSHNFILVYARDAEAWKKTRNRLPRNSAQEKQYTNPDGDPRGPWRSIPWDAPNVRPNLEYRIETPSGDSRYPPPGRHWSRTEEQWLALVSEGLAYFGKKGNGAPAFKQYLADAAPIVPNTWWSHDEAGHNDEAKKETFALFGKDDIFATPKPERLMERILTIASSPGDLVLDSFLGSGTTSAVAHKMGRRWIGIELGDHALTHCAPRLKKVIDGEDPGGITASTNWKGGGGFRFYRLAPSLLEKDKWGNWVVSKQYNGPMLAEALCKLEGFRYAPDAQVFWMHGRATETAYLYATDQSLTTEQLEYLSAQVGPERSLTICCAAWRGNQDQYPNLTLRKIPQAVFAKCEWGRDDYSLNVEELTPAPRTRGEGPKRPKKQKSVQELPLFRGVESGGGE